MRSFLILVCAGLAALASPAAAAAPSGSDIGLAAPAPRAKTSAPVPSPDGMSRTEIRAATAGLAVAGYAPGPVDGDWDQADRAALTAYQADWQLPRTGELTPELLQRLLREHPATRSRWVETVEGCRVWNRYPQAQEVATWTGECVGGATSGEGRLTWTAILRGKRLVETYTGERRDGRENGRGLYVSSDGSRYLGDWRNGLNHGRGIYVSAEGHVYVGEYRNGMRHGRGFYARTEGASYAGEWRDGTQHGRGAAVWPDGSVYEGLLADGKPQGEGTLTFTDGNVYWGEWRAGCFAEAMRGATAGVTQADCGWR